MRVYCLKYKVYHANGGGFKYASNPSYDEQVIFYKRDERDQFIKDYKRVSDPTKKGFYYDDIECLVGELNEIKDMQPVIDAI